MEYITTGQMHRGYAPSVVVYTIRGNPVILPVLPSVLQRLAASVGRFAGAFAAALDQNMTDPTDG